MPVGTTGIVSYANYQLGLIKSSDEGIRYNPFGQIENTFKQV